MEMEPVSRLLGEYMLQHTNEEAYALFVSTFLHINVLSDFRSRKHAFYYSSDEKEYIEGMKIIPLQTDVLKVMLQRKLKYSALYKIFSDAYASSDNPPKEWYAENIVTKINDE